MRSANPKGHRAPLACGSLVIALALTGGVIADDEEGMIEWADVPEAVQEAIETHLPEAVGSAVERELEDGVWLYEAEVYADGRESEIKVTESGAVVEIEEELDPAELPAEILASVRSLFPDAEILEAEKMMRVAYEVELRVGERVVEVEISPTGETEVEIEDEKEEEYEEHENEEHEHED
jgi:uncharacterized membrane protein YkoI